MTSQNKVLSLKMNWIKAFIARRKFYMSALGRDILACYRRSKVNARWAKHDNKSLDKSKFINQHKIAWSIAHRLYIAEDE